MTLETLLRAAYGANILILLPVVATMARPDGTATIFGPAVPESPGLRLLVAALWTGIMVASALGLFAPRAFAGVLVLQVVYKALWLGLFILPLWRAEGAAAVPWDPVVPFALIVLLWPLLIAALWRAGHWSV